MQEKLQIILNDNADYIEQYKSKRNKLLSRIEFSQTHNFKEEERITRLEFEAIDMLVYRYENFYNDIQDLLNDWHK